MEHHTKTSPRYKVVLEVFGLAVQNTNVDYAASHIGQLIAGKSHKYGLMHGTKHVVKSCVDISCQRFIFHKHACVLSS